MRGCNESHPKNCVIYDGYRRWIKKTNKNIVGTSNELISLNIRQTNCTSDITINVVGFSSELIDFRSAKIDKKIHYTIWIHNFVYYIYSNDATTLVFIFGI